MHGWWPGMLGGQVAATRQQCQNALVANRPKQGGFTQETKPEGWCPTAARFFGCPTWGAALSKLMIALKRGFSILAWPGAPHVGSHLQGCEICLEDIWADLQGSVFFNSED